MIFNLPRENKSRRRRAFIAAPLLGAIVFLASVIFVVNWSKQESAETARVVSEAYHNRLTSLLEVYRSDVAALFRNSLTQVIEGFLSKQCWLNLFLISNVPIDYSAELLECKNENCEFYPNAVITLKEARYLGCKRANRVILESICSIPQDCGRQVPGCECTIPTSEKCEECCAKNLGLTKWLGFLIEPVTFEGVTYSLANREQVQAFIEPDLGFVDRCKALLQGSLFDCEAFAGGKQGGTPKLQCWDDKNKNGELDRSSNPEEDEYVAGCEEGSFQVKVTVTNDVVYPNLPRIEASDGFGNSIRSGAIGEEDFNLPITYPLFRYYNHAFEFHEDLNGKTPVDPDVIKGACVQGIETTPEGSKEGKCEQTQNYYDEAYYTVQGDKAEEKAKEKLQQDFFEKKLMPACDEQYKKKDLREPRALQLCTAASSCGSSDFNAEAWKIDCASNEGGYPGFFNKLADGGNSIKAQSAGSLAGGPSAYYETIELKARFTDYSPAHQVDPVEQNRFCARIIQSHVCKENDPANPEFKKTGSCSQ